MQKKEMERIIIDRENIDFIEEDIIIRRGIERYMYARQFVYGKVIDIACGSGYGSYIMSKNPDVSKITGVDRNEGAIQRANREFHNEKVNFVLNEFETMSGNYDVLVCLETIEHLKNPKVITDLVKNCNIQEVIISFPHKKTTHFNQYHLWDITEEDVVRILQGFQCYKKYKLHDSTIMNLVKIERIVKNPNRFN